MATYKLSQRGTIASVSDTNNSSPPSCSCSATASLTITVTWVPDPALTDDPPPPNLWLIEGSNATWGGGPRVGTNSTTANPPPGGANIADIAAYISDISEGQDTALNANPSLSLLEAGEDGDDGGDSGCVWTYVGKADDGIKDPEIAGTTMDVMGVSNSGNVPASTPSLHWKKYDSSSGVIHIPARTLTASASVTQTTPGMNTVNCVLGPYTLTIHAHPYNFRLTPGTSAMPNPRISGSTLVCHYDWLSTSGKLSDINAGSKIYEHLEYSGAGSTTAPGTFGDQGRTIFMPANPPFGQYWRKPIIIDPAKFYNDIGQGAIWANPQDGYFEDGHKMESALTPVNGTYPAGAFDAAQQYRYYCADEKCPDHIYLPSTYTNNPNRPDDPLVVVAKGTTSATATISRTVTPDGQGSAFYKCVKSIAPGTVVTVFVQ